MEAFGNTRTAKVDGTTLAYREEGAGEPVVFVHGGTADLRVWEGQLPEVARSYRAISYSQRYCRPNESIQPDAPNPLDPHVDDLAALQREIGAAPAHLVGSSSGAFLCLLAALRHPELVSSLVLEEPPVLSLFVSTPPRPSELLRLFARHPRTAAAIAAFGLRIMAPVTRAFQRGDDEEALEIFLRGVLGRRTREALSEPAVQVLRDNVGTLRGSLLHDYKGFPRLGAAELRALATPVLLVSGQRSPALFRCLTDRLEELLPRAERVDIPGASHVMHMESPAAVNRAILDFLGRQCGPSRVAPASEGSAR